MFLQNIYTKKYFILFLLVLLWGHSAAAEPTSRFRIGGTGSALATMRLLVAEYQKVHPDIQIQVPPSLGSTGGVKALLDGALDICLVARPLTQAEADAQLTYRPYARTAIIFAVNPLAGVSALNYQQIAEILAGNLTRWPNGEYIRPIIRSMTESDLLPIFAFSPQLKKAFITAAKRPELIFAPTAQDNVNILLSLPGAFGVSSLAQIHSEKAFVIPLTLAGVEPTLENLATGRYPFGKDFALVYQDSKLPAKLRPFIDFIFSRQACGILTENSHNCLNDRSPG